MGRLSRFCAFSAAAALTAQAAVPTVRLRNGVEMPVVAVGTWQYNDTLAQAVVQTALDDGYTHIDTAHDYGNQKGVSAGLNLSGKKRKDFFLTTKVPGCGLQGVRSDQCYADTVKFLKEDFDQLNKYYPVEILDLVLIHFPPCVEDGNPTPNSPLDSKCFKDKTGCKQEHCKAIQDQWAAMEEAYEANLTRAIGVSNYCSACLECLAAKAKIMPMVNQVQYHIGMGADPQGFKTTAERMGMVLQAWSPLGAGGHGSSEILKGNLTTSIGAKYQKSAAQVALKWILSNNVSVATKSSKEVHLKENLALFDFEFTAEDKASLDAATFSSKDHPSFLCSDPDQSSTVGLTFV